MRPVERTVISVVARRFRSRAVVELENLALRHQLRVLRRQRPGRLTLFTFDRLLWVLLYRLWPRCLETMVLVKPATVIQWHCCSKQCSGGHLIVRDLHAGPTLHGTSRFHSNGASPQTEPSVAV